MEKDMQDVSLQGSEVREDPAPPRPLKSKSGVVWKFITGACLLTIAGLIVIVAVGPRTEECVTPTIHPALMPTLLSNGDTVGFISPGYPPAYYWDSEPRTTTYEQYVVNSMAPLGLTVKQGSNAMKIYGYLAGTDDQRSSDIMAMFRDTNVKGIISNRGGYGCNRLLGLLDYQQIKDNPKPLMGYSDLTGLINAVNAQTGMITFHGPMGTSAWDNINANFEWTQKMLLSDLKSGSQIVLQNGPAPRWPVTTTILPGKAVGKLVGGNLSVLAALVGTPYLPSLKGAILFLEEVGERPYSVDRMLATFARAGHLKELAGFVWGTCESCDPRDASKEFTLDQVLDQYILPLQIPAFKGLGFGHIDEQLIVPVGAMAEMDATQHTITVSF